MIKIMNNLVTDFINYMKNTETPARAVLIGFVLIVITMFLAKGIVYALGIAGGLAVLYGVVSRLMEEM